jgi:hypothetical protein
MAGRAIAVSHPLVLRLLFYTKAVQKQSNIFYHFWNSELVKCFLGVQHPI